MGHADIWPLALWPWSWMTLDRLLISGSVMDEKVRNLVSHNESEVYGS